MRKNKKALVLLHGAVGSQTQFTGLIAELRGYYDVFSLDFDGHGGLPLKQPYSIDGFTNNVLEFLEEKQLQKPHVFGFSMGGYVALNLAANHPGKIERIMTLGTKLAWNKSVAQKEVALLDADTIIKKLPGFAQRLADIHAPTDWKIVLAHAQHLLLELGERPVVTDYDLISINNPVLLGLGSEDLMVTKEESEHAADLLPNGRFLLIDGFKHPIEKIDPVRLSEIIREFLVD